jgi:hypothetical protein
LRECLSDVDIFDPRRHGQEDEDRYTFWDLEAIRRSDWVFAFLERDNPGGFSLALEVGFAKALDKKIILVDEKSSACQQDKRYLGMLRSSADLLFEDFGQATEFLKSMEKS